MPEPESELLRDEDDEMIWAQPTARERELAEFILLALKRFSETAGPWVGGAPLEKHGTRIDGVFDMVRVARAIIDRCMDAR